MDPSSRKPDLSRLKIEHDREYEDRRRSYSLPAVVALAIALAVGGTAAIYWFGGRAEKTGPSAAVRTESESSETRASAAPVQSFAPTVRVLNATGYVVAQRRAAVSSKATGRLKELKVKEGDTVIADQILGVLENEDLTQLVERIKASIVVSRAKVQSAEAELWYATTDRNRLASLSSHAVSQADKDAAEGRYRRAIAELAAQRATVVVEEAARKEAEVNLGYTYIRAPFNGTVLTKNADIGEVVAPFGSATDARGALVTIADMSSLQVEADVSEANFSKVFVGQQCKIVLDSFPDKTYQGVVDSIVPTVDRAKATVLVKIKFLDKDSNVIPEMSAKVEFALAGQ